MQIIIRMDDITPDMDWERFLKIKGILDQYNVRPLVGVVPENRDVTLSHNEKEDNFWEIVRSLKDDGWDVAQHGTFHEYVTENAGLLGINNFSEFAGLSYDEQYNKLKKGKDILIANGIETDIFMAPGHTFDINTLKALKELGFRTITDGLSKKIYVREGIICVPCRLSSFSNIHGLDTICLHTNNMENADFDEFEHFVASNVEKVISYKQALVLNKTINYNVVVGIGEKIRLIKRQLRDKIANSKKMAWYLNYTNHSNAVIKWLKRVIFVPMLFSKKEEEKLEEI